MIFHYCRINYSYLWSRYRLLECKFKAVESPEELQNSIISYYSFLSFIISFIGCNSILLHCSMLVIFQVRQLKETILSNVRYSAVSTTRNMTMSRRVRRWLIFWKAIPWSPFPSNTFFGMKYSFEFFFYVSEQGFALNKERKKRVGHSFINPNCINLSVSKHNCWKQEYWSVKQASS